MSKLRTFVAVELAERVQRRAADLIRRLQASGAQVKWIYPANMHVTMSFLGEVDERDVPAVCSTVAAAATPLRPFVLQCQGVSAFPQPERPRTIWIDVSQGKAEVCQLQEAVAKALAGLGFPREQRRYHPHLTIGRVKRPGPWMPALVEMMRELRDFDAGPTPVGEVVVFSSQLHPSGPVYEALSRVPLSPDL